MMHSNEKEIRMINGQNLEKCIVQLESELRLKNKWISLLIHEFKSSFSNLQWIIEALEKGSISNALLTELIPELKNSANNNFKLLQNTYDWIKSQDAHFELHPTRISVEGLFDHLNSFFKQQLNSKQQQIDFHGHQGLEIISDEVLLLLILKKVVDNAIKYSNKHSRISISATLLKSEFIEFVVRDEGMGMSAETFDNLFTLEGNCYLGTENESGPGLGLVFVKEFLDMIEGSIEIESVLSKGTRVRLLMHNLV